MTPQEALSLKIADLSEAVTSSLLGMPTLLRTIRDILKNDPDLTTMLSSQEVAIIVGGLSKQTMTQITTSILSGGKGKALKNLGLDDI